MKKLFNTSIMAFILFEFILNYFTMDYPFSQKIGNVQFTHFLFQIKIYVEILLLLAIVYASIAILKTKPRTRPILLLLFAVFVYYFTNLLFTAEHFYQQPKHLVFEDIGHNKVPKEMIVIGIEINGQARAYPLPALIYHHQILDTIGGKKIITTFCLICHTARTFEPYIDGKYNKFRLVGIIHRNATLEDESTKSWWSQQTGVCIAGKLKGQSLPEISTSYMTLEKWMELYPNTTIMQPDPTYESNYIRYDFYKGNARRPIVHNKDDNWDKHTYIVGVSAGNARRAYEWNHFSKVQLINDSIDHQKIVLALSKDTKSFSVLKNPSNTNATLLNDTLYIDHIPYNMAGVNLITHQKELDMIKSYREFWFTWLFANPATTRYLPNNFHIK
jgi:Protein of unknown function (DUF3179)